MEPELLGLRRDLERSFLTALRADVPGSIDVATEVDALLVEPVDAGGISHHLRPPTSCGNCARPRAEHRSPRHAANIPPRNLAFVAGFPVEQIGNCAEFVDLLLGMGSEDTAGMG